MFMIASFEVVWRAKIGTFNAGFTVKEEPMHTHKSHFEAY